MKLIRLTLSFIFMCIFYSSVSFAVEITTDEDLLNSIKSLGESFASAYAAADNCEDEEALNRISVLKRRALELYADKGFSRSAIYKLSDYIDDAMKGERKAQNFWGCSKSASKGFMYVLETEYQDWEKALQHYIMPY